MDGRGYYVATLDPAGRRVRSDGLFARGSGTWTIDDAGLSFLRTLTKKPIRIPNHRINSVGVSGSSWWGGRWLPGSKVIEVRWIRDDGSQVVSGFVLSGKSDVEEVVSRLLRP
jgi:hypothetical protein